jgi:CRP/FNR family transcriptional regulator, cyclic AMP receptor protein
MAMNQERLLPRIGLFRAREHKPMSTEKLLSQVGIFRSLDQQQLAQLATCTEMRQYEAGQVVVAENETADGLHIVVSGLLLLSKERPGREPMISGALEPGQYCCEMALLEDSPRAASVVAAEATTCLTLGKERFQRELAAHPAIAVALVFEVSRRLRDTLDLLDANA